MSVPRLDSTLLSELVARRPTLWINPGWRPMADVRAELPMGPEDLLRAHGKWARFAPLLGKLFPELAHTQGGVVESALLPAGNLQRQMSLPHPSGRWFIKGDHALPIAGSIKARGGIYEVLLHAEEVALEQGILKSRSDDSSILVSPEARAVFSQYEVAVGSTGNLGLSIGIVAAALGFRATVHMSADAKPWKKARLKRAGVEVIEHPGDYSAAVAAGREQAQRHPRSYFVDDESSPHLFLGYGVAALRLIGQLAERQTVIDEAHPLFVYIPCGVGGAPGGITFGLRQLLGDHVHCFFAEPTASPCMLLRLAGGSDCQISVRDIGLDNRTAADGLAVATASELAAAFMRPLASGVFTVSDDQLFEDLYWIAESEGLRVEPSAAASLRGPRRLLTTAAGRDYIERHRLAPVMARATHVLWTTGGAFVPADEYAHYHERGRLLALAAMSGFVGARSVTGDV